MLPVNRLFITLHLPQLFLQSNSVSNPSLKVLYGHENRLVTVLDPSWHLLLNYFEGIGSFNLPTDCCPLSFELFLLTVKSQLVFYTC